jgi:hypothetical protein
MLHKLCWNNYIASFITTVSWKFKHNTVRIPQCNLVVESQYVIQLNERKLQISNKELPTHQPRNILLLSLQQPVFISLIVITLLLKLAHYSFWLMIHTLHGTLCKKPQPMYATLPFNIFLPVSYSQFLHWQQNILSTLVYILSTLAYIPPSKYYIINCSETMIHVFNLKQKKNFISHPSTIIQVKKKSCPCACY